jgi:tartrate dehydrogenase/decarboxylase/D-malate dehydrogenase
MMLEHLEEAEASKSVFDAIKRVLASSEPPLTPDMGGTATTRELGRAIVEAL